MAKKSFTISEQIRNKSYHEIIDELGDRQKEVFEVLKNSGPLSNEEVAEKLKRFPHTVTPRVLELRELGLVEFAGTTKSKTSKKTVSLCKVKETNIAN